MSDTKEAQSSKTAAAYQQSKGTADEEEREHFLEEGRVHWSEGHPLHLLNKLRVPAVVDALLPPTEQNRALREGPLPLRGFRILDVGCGGGLLSEPLAKLGAEVVGIDFLPENINIAESHAQKDTELTESGRLRYVCATIEDYIVKVGGTAPGQAEAGGKGESATPTVPPEAAFDLVVASEVVEHVADLPLFVRCIVPFARPGGAFFFTTINRTWRAFFLMIVLGEYILRFIPRGTHHYAKLVPPEELRIQLEKNGCTVEEMHGLAYNPCKTHWCWIESTAYSYRLRARKASAPVASSNEQ